MHFPGKTCNLTGKKLNKLQYKVQYSSIFFLSFSSLFSKRLSIYTYALPSCFDTKSCLFWSSKENDFKIHGTQLLLNILTTSLKRISRDGISHVYRFNT